MANFEAAFSFSSLGFPDATAHKKKQYKQTASFVKSLLPSRSGTVVIYTLSVDSLSLT